MERKRVLVAFGDILGFAPWIRRAITTPEESRDLIEDVYNEFERIALRMDCYVKFLGDGIMIIKEVTEKKDNPSLATAAASFLKDIFELSESTTKIILRHFPRPDGFRMRVGIGHVWKREMAPKTPEYIGYIINLTQRLTKVSSRIPCICHQSVKEIFLNVRSGIKFERIRKSDEKPLGIDLEDLENLWMFSVNEAK